MGGILATPVSDTLKQMTAETIAGIYNRLRIAAIYPGRANPADVSLRAAWSERLRLCWQAQQMPTDEASAIEYSVEQAMIVEGRRDNIKITHREDLIIAQAIMGYQETEQCA